MFSIPCINDISILMVYPLGFFYQFSLFVVFPRKRLQRHCRTAAQSKFLISVSQVFSQCDTDSYCEHTADGVYMQFSSFVSVCWSLCVLSLSLCVCVSLCVFVCDIKLWYQHKTYYLCETFIETYNFMHKQYSEAQGTKAEQVQNLKCEHGIIKQITSLHMTQKRRSRKNLKISGVAIKTRKDIDFKSLRLRSVVLLKKRLWQRCFPLNFVKFLRTAFLIKRLWWLLLLPLYCLFC